MSNNEDRLNNIMKETPVEKFAKKYKEVVKAFISLRRESHIQALTINSVSIPDIWTEKYPDLITDINNILGGRLMGLKVEQIKTILQTNVPPPEDIKEYGNKMSKAKS